MQENELSYTRPINIFFLMLPGGISSGFLTVTLPYLLIQNGFSVALTAGIVAISASASLWRILWAPLGDLTLSLKKWYWIGVLGSIVSMMVLCFTPFTTEGVSLLTAVVFILSVVYNLLFIFVGGIIANRVEGSKKGRAGGWYQAGNLGGVGLGGGAGLWLATHYNVSVAGLVLCAVSLLSALVVMRIKDVQSNNQNGFKTEFINLGKDVLAMVKIPVVLFIIIMLCMPIGTGASANLWSAIAGDWKTDADTVALVTGLLGGLVGVVGSIAGGFLADRFGHWIAYLGSGTVCALVTVLMAVFPMEPYVYVTGVLAYGFGIGLINAAFSYVILYAVGTKNATTKYSLLSSLGNVPVVYMTAVNGWAHDRYNSKIMLLTEAALCIAFVVLCVLVLNWMGRRKLLVKEVG
jgi:PAT family beta-lactamase induction signal transducer AmpG